MESKTKEHFNKCSKEIVKNAYEFCRKEEKEDIQISLKKCLLRTELLTGVNKRTVQRVLRSSPELQENAKPKPQESRTQISVQCDDFNKCVIRRTVQSMYEEKKVLLTLKNIREILKEKIEFFASLSTLSKVLKGLGFSYKRCVQNRKVLMERPDVVAHRIRFLRQIKSYREEGRPVIYTDETNVHMQRPSAGNPKILV